MVLSETFLCRVPSENSVKIDRLYCSTDATNAPEIFSAIGTCAAALFAALAAIAAIYIYSQDKARYRKQEIREATAALISAVHTLATNSKDPLSDNEKDRNNTYKESVLFELAAGPALDRERFNAAVNWILKSARLRYFAAQERHDLGRVAVSQHAFVRDLVNEMTESLRYFDQSSGKFNLSSDLAERFTKVFESPSYRTNVKIQLALNSPEPYYEKLTGKKFEVKMTTTSSRRS